MTLGLTWTDHFTILGIDIDNKLQCLDENFNRINKKVRGIISRWTGYNLSFHGKITVCKTLLLSQYTYVGGIMDCIKTTQLQQIQSQLDYFINHGKNTPKAGAVEKMENLWIDTKSLCNDKNNGGFGCINIKDFFAGLKLSWLRCYAIQKVDNHWCGHRVWHNIEK